MMSVLLTACCRDSFEYQNLILPDLIEYPTELQIQGAKEIRDNDVPVLAEFMKDYKVMRDQVRVAKGAVICPNLKGSIICD